MLVKLTKSAQWGGEKRRGGTIHDLPPHLADKLIRRGYAVEKVADDGSRDGHGTGDIPESE